MQDMYRGALKKPRPKEEPDFSAIRVATNKDGVPLFPALDILSVPLKRLMEILQEYLRMLWGEYTLSLAILTFTLF